MLLTRGTIRTAVASQVGDLRPITTTVVGSLSTLRDDRNLTEEDNGYAGCDLMFTGPTALLQGQSRYVSSSDFATSTLSFRPNVAVIVPVGETAELYNYRQMGCTIEEYNQYINNAIFYAQNFALIRLELSLGTFVNNTNWSWDLTSAPYQQSIPLPDFLKYVSRISYLKDGLTYYPERGSQVARDGWWLDGPTRRLVVEGCLPDQMDGALVSAVGFGPPQPLYSDADPIDIYPEWIFCKVKAQVYARMVEKGLADKRSDAALNEGMAQNAERQLRPDLFPPNTLRVW